MTTSLRGQNTSELKRGFVNKLNLIKRSRFLPRNSLLDLYFKVFLPSVTYALPVWGSCTNKNEFNSLEFIHCRAARVIYNLPRDMPSEDVRKTANWDSLFDTYKVKIATLIYNIYNRITPSCLDHIIQRKESKYDLRYQHRVSVQRFETYYMKNSISYRGSIVWNLLEPSAVSARDYAKRAKKSHASETGTLMKSHRKWVVPKLTVISSFINSIHSFYCTYFTFY